MRDIFQPSVFFWVVVWVVTLIATNPVPVAAVASGGGVLPNGNFQLKVQEPGSVVQTVVIEANTSLSNPLGWVPIGSIFSNSSVFTFTDTNATRFPVRFYRIVAP